MRHAIGIDLGTTYSAIAHLTPAGRPEILPNAEGERLTPSVVSFATDPPTVGQQAKERQALGDIATASFFKRSMGDPNFILELASRSWTPVELSALVLGKLKADAEAALGAALTHAVITVPAYFNNDQRQATIDAGARAGLQVLRVINEPTAAALAYGLHRSGKTETVLVYDLGGGTFDVSLVRLTPDEVAVLATAGDHNLGGKDWDDRVAVYAAERFADVHSVNPLDEAAAFNDLLVRAEKAKRELSARQQTTLVVHHEGRRETVELTRAAFADLTRDLMERTQNLAEQVLREASLTWPALTGVLLVGGSTRMPMVQEYVQRMSGKPPMTGVNVDEAVALGAAVQAGLDLDQQAGARAPRFFLGGGRRIRDVMSHSLGVVVQNEQRTGLVNSILIPKNTPVPCTQAKEYQVHTQPGRDNQLDVYMLQGESSDPTQCHVLGKYVFSGITHAPRGPAVVEIAYGYDQNGVITVTARDRGTGKDLALCVEPLPPGDRSWLAAVGKSPAGGRPGLLYAAHAGLHHIPGAMTDQYGNAAGSQYDLAEDGAFEGCVIVVLLVCYHEMRAQGLDFARAEQALTEKGFKVRCWNKVPGPTQLARDLDDACQLWVLSGAGVFGKQELEEAHVEVIHRFFRSGRGLYVWGDNDPFTHDANLVAETLLDCQLAGNTPGKQVVRLQQAPGQPGFLSHLLTTGIESLYEGHTVATVVPTPLLREQILAGIPAHLRADMAKRFAAKPPGKRILQPLLYGSAGNLIVALYDEDGKRAILDGGYTRLFFDWDTAGTDRYVKNAACWLVNHETLGDRVVRRRRWFR